MPHLETISSLSKRLGRESGLLTAWVGISEPMIAGQLALEDFDVVTVDMQHGANDITSVREAIVQVTFAGKPTLVRIPVNDFSTASRVLDFGAAGVIAPMINSKQDAENFVKAMKFPPVGERSWGPTIAVAHTGQSLDDYLKQANGMSVAIAMIETREALAALDDILALDGIDAVFVGPSDLSIALSKGSNVNPGRADVLEALEHVMKRAHAHKKSACCFAPSPSMAKDLAAKGYDLMAIGTDFGQLRSGARAQIDLARGRS